MNQTAVHAAAQAAAGPMTPTVPSGDRTTRQLIIAAHLDPGFASQVVDEYLREPLRSLPSSSGLNTAAVLSEAVAAHTRRRIRDWILLSAAALLAILNVASLIVWLLVAIAARLMSQYRSSKSPAVQAALGVVGLVMAFVAFLLLTVLTVGDGLVSTLGGDLPGGGLTFGIGAWFGSMLLFGGAIFAVLLADEQVRWWIATRSLPRFPTPGPRQPWPHEAEIRSLGVNRFRAQIDAVAQQAAQGNVLVFRGKRPFVGFGSPVRSSAFAMALVPTEETDHDDRTDHEDLPHRNDGEMVARFLPTDLYQHVYREFLKLRTGDSLVPDMRLRNLELSHFVAVDSEAILDHLDNPRAAWVLPNLHRPPAAAFSVEQLMEAANRPVEWMRYYQQIQVESWDRELVVTLFLHVGCDDRMLYVDWTCCALNPIHTGLRELRPEHPPLRSALGNLVTFPLSLPGRLQIALRRIGPRKRTRFVSASTYGTARSIRELATADTARSYFENADVQRYSSILIRHMSGAIADFLASRGVSAREFVSRVTNILQQTINDNSIKIGGDNNAPVTGGTSGGSSGQSK